MPILPLCWVLIVAPKILTKVVAMAVDGNYFRGEEQYISQLKYTYKNKYRETHAISEYLPTYFAIQLLRKHTRSYVSLYATCSLGDAFRCKRCFLFYFT